VNLLEFDFTQFFKRLPKESRNRNLRTAMNEYHLTMNDANQVVRSIHNGTFNSKEPKRAERVNTDPYFNNLLCIENA
jgi:hypothetical protein